MNNNIKYIVICVVLLVLGVLLIKFTLPVGAILAATAGAWWLVRTNDNIYIKATAPILASTSFGLAIVCGLLIVFNMFKQSLQPHLLFNIVSAISWLRKFLSIFTNMSSLELVGVFAVLIVLSYFLPQLKPASRFFAVKSSASKIVVALTVATSFSFFSKAPFDHFVVDVQDNLRKEYLATIDNYKALLNDNWKQVGRYLAAKNLEYQAEKLSNEAKNDFKVIVEAIAAETSNIYIVRDIARGVTNNFFELSTQEQTIDAERVKLEWIEYSINQFRSAANEFIENPTTEDGLRQNIEIITNLAVTVENQKKSNDTATAKANEQCVVLNNTLSTLVSSVIPEIGGPVGDIIKAITDTMAEVFVDKSATPVVSSLIRRFKGNQAMSSLEEIVNESENVYLPSLDHALKIGNKFGEDRAPAIESTLKDIVAYIHSEAMMAARVRESANYKETSTKKFNTYKYSNQSEIRRKIEEMRIPRVHPR